MFCEEIRIKQGLVYISICSLSILYNSKFLLMTTSLGTNAVVVTRVHCKSNCIYMVSFVLKFSILCSFARLQKPNNFVSRLPYNTIKGITGSVTESVL